MITIAEQIEIPSPPARVWQVLSNPADVVSCIGGAELGPSQEDGSFEGALQVRFGGLRVRFAARLRLELDEPEREGQISGGGRDAQGGTRVNGAAVFRVREGSRPGDAVVTLNGEVNVSGKLSSLIDAGAAVVVSRMTREFALSLVSLCTAGEAGEAGEAATGQAAEPPAARHWLARLRAWLLRLPHPRSSAREQPVPQAPASLSRQGRDQR